MPDAIRRVATKVSWLKPAPATAIRATQLFVGGESPSPGQNPSQRAKISKAMYHSQPHRMLAHSMPKQSNALSWLMLSALIIVADQISKWFVLEHFQLHESLPVIDGLLSWTLAFNEGAAFNFLSDAGGWQRWFFTALAYRCLKHSRGLAEAHEPQ